MDNSYGFSGSELLGKKVFISKGLELLSAFEGNQIVELCGGNPQKSANQSCELVVTSETYIENHPEKHNLISETDFFHLVGIDMGEFGVANRWVIVDDYLEGGKVDVSNEPAWDGHKAPYKLFIQRGTTKSTSAGGWNIIACGALSDNGYPKFMSQPWYLNPQKKVLGHEPETNEEFDYKDLIGAVVVQDEYAPKSCAYLFDGLVNCSEFTLRKLSTANADSMQGMFRGCASVKYLMDMGQYDTSNITTMTDTFFGCRSLKVVDLLGWSVANTKSMVSMFENSPAYALVSSQFKEAVSTGSINTKDMFNSGIQEGNWLKSLEK